MAESDGITRPRKAFMMLGIGVPRVKYQLVFAYQTYTKYSNPQGLPSSVDSSPVFNIKMFPPNLFQLERAIAAYNDPNLFTGCYCYGDPGSWAPLFPSRDATVDELNDWEIMVSEQEFTYEENFRDNGSRTRASATQRNPDDDKKYIIKHRGGDAVLDDNGNKMLLIKCFPGPSPNQTEELSVFHFKRIVDGQKTLMTERELDRLRRYLSGDFDGEGEESGQGGEGKKEEVDEEEEVKDPDEIEDEDEQEA